MEDAVQALKMAFAVFVFVIAISVAFYVISKAKATSETIFYVSDKTNYYDNVESNSNVTRTVGLETVIPTLYRYYRENFMVQIMKSDGTILQVFDTTTEWEVSNAAKVIANKRNDRQKILISLYGDKNKPTNMFGAPWVGTTDEDAKARIDLYIKGGKGYINNALVDYTNKGLFSNGIKETTQFEEIFTEYQFSGQTISDEDGEYELIGDKRGSKKIVITYKVIENNE